MLSKEEYKERLKVLFSEMLDELPENFYELSSNASSLDIDLTLFFDASVYQIEETWAAEVLEMPDAYIEGYSRERKVFDDFGDFLKAVNIDFSEETSFSDKYFKKFSKRK